MAENNGIESEETLLSFDIIKSEGGDEEMASEIENDDCMEAVEEGTVALIEEEGETSTRTCSKRKAVGRPWKAGASTADMTERVTRSKAKYSKYLAQISLTYSKEFHFMDFDQNYHEDDMDYTAETFRFFTTTKTKRNLYIKGYVYVLSRFKSDRSYWRCQIKACRGCTCVKFKENSVDQDWKEVFTTENLVVTSDSKRLIHVHPPYLSFEKMVEFYDTRWEKIRKHIPVRGQKLGRFVREGQPPPQRYTRKKKDNVQEMMRKSLEWKKSTTDVAAEEPLVPTGEVPNDPNQASTMKDGWASTYSDEYYDLDYDAFTNLEGDNTLEEITPPPEDFRFFSTTKCKQLLYLNGFIYHLNRARGNVASYWRCQFRECCGCAVLKMKPNAPEGTQWHTVKQIEFLTVSKSVNLKIHCHPPFRCFNVMVRFFEDRWERLKKHVKVGGRRYGRYIPPGEYIAPRTNNRKNPKPIGPDNPTAYAHIVCQIIHAAKNVNLFAEGYLYQQSGPPLEMVNLEGETRINWRCRNGPCMASLATISKDGKHVIVNMDKCHAHAPAESYALALKQRAQFMETMRKINAGEKISTLPIISLEEEGLEDTLNVNFFDAGISGMENGEDDSDYSMVADEDNDPPLDDTSKEEIIVMENCLTLSGDKFLQDIVNADDGTKILLFITLKNIEFLSTASTWLMDSVRSSKMPELFTHLFTIRARVRYGEPLPLVFALMTTASQEAFRALFIDLKVLASGARVSLNPVRIITELDENVFKASKEIFHETQLIAGHYHLTKMISDRVSFILMNMSYLNGESLKKTGKKLVAMAFLSPDKIKEVWKELKDSTSVDEEPLVNWFQEVFVLGPVLKVDGSMNFHSTPTFPPVFWSQDQLLHINNSQQPFQNLLSDAFRDWHWKWSTMMQRVDGDGVNQLIDVLKKEQEETETAIRNRLACQERQLLGEALSDVLANRPFRRNLDLVNELSLLMDVDDPVPVFAIEVYA